MNEGANPPPAADGEKLPDITAKVYDLTIIGRSRSQKVYMAKNNVRQAPNPGRIILLKQELRNIMAFRVLKAYPNTQQFAIKRVRVYPGYPNLNPGVTFRAIEKIADYFPPPPTEQDKRDLRELEGNLEDPTAALEELPSNTDDENQAPAPPDPGLSQREAQVLDETEDQDPDDLVIVEEPVITDFNFHSLTLQFGQFRNYNVNAISSTYGGGGLRYGYSFAHMIFLNKSRLHDSFTLEGGIALYRIINYDDDDETNDTYTLVPVIGTLRYNILFGESYGFFVYGGMLKNTVVSQVSGVEEDVIQLGSTLPAFGVGGMMQVGPNWELRVDLGLDFIGAGLVLRF